MKQFCAVLLFFVFSAYALNAQEEQASPKWRFSASGGIGYSFAGTSSGSGTYVNQEKLDEYSDKARWAKLLNADVHYFFRSGWGLGLRYQFQTAATEGKDFIQDTGDGVHYVVGDASETAYVNYAGVSVASRRWIGNNGKFLLFSAASIGYAAYRDEMSLFYSKYLLTSGNFASAYELGIEYFLQPFVSLGLNLGFFTANFYSVKLTDGSQTSTTKLDSDNRINASNLNMSAGIRYYINK